MIHSFTLILMSRSTLLKWAGEIAVWPWSSDRWKSKTLREPPVVVLSYAFLILKWKGEQLSEPSVRKPFGQTLLLALHNDAAICSQLRENLLNSGSDYKTVPKLIKTRLYNNLCRTPITLTINCVILVIKNKRIISRNRIMLYLSCIIFNGNNFDELVTHVALVTSKTAHMQRLYHQLKQAYVKPASLFLWWLNLYRPLQSIPQIVITCQP